MCSLVRSIFSTPSGLLALDLINAFSSFTMNIKSLYAVVQAEVVVLSRWMPCKTTTDFHSHWTSVANKSVELPWELKYNWTKLHLPISWLHRTANNVPNIHSVSISQANPITWSIASLVVDVLIYTSVKLVDAFVNASKNISVVSRKVRFLVPLQLWAPVFRAGQICTGNNSKWNSLFFRLGTVQPPCPKRCLPFPLNVKTVNINYYLKHINTCCKQ